jgi:hypothetical protein
MKIFETYDKVNFVDKNNVFVGYDMGQACCENAYWLISESDKYDPEISYEDKEVDYLQYTYTRCESILEDYVFDTKKFYEKYYNPVFKLIAKGKKDLYLHLYNEHNGYYAHGFVFGNKNIDKIYYESYI